MSTITLPLVTAQNMVQLALAMGTVIRSSTEADDHSELWTNDGDYILAPQFVAFHKAVAQAELRDSLACYVIGDDAGLSHLQFLQMVVYRIQDDIRDGTYEGGPNSNNPGGKA